MSSSEIALTAILALFVITSIYLVAQQITRERWTQDENARLRQEIDSLRRENTMLVVGSNRLATQVENMEGIPIWRVPNGTVTPPEKDATLNAMQTLFTREELELLANDAGLEWEHVAGFGLPVMALRLMEQAKHRGLEGRLIDAVRRARPNAADCS